MFAASDFVYYVSHLKKDKELAIIAAKYFTFSYLGLCILSIISGSYFGFAIYRVKKLIIEHKDLVNTKIMSMHAISFSVYMLSTIVSVVALGLSAWGIISYEIYWATKIFTIFCSSITQALMCYIFCNIGSI